MFKENRAMKDECSDNYLLEIVLPTYNRPEALKHYLRIYKKTFEGFLSKILLSVHDSSLNDDTEKIVISFMLENRNIRYVKYPTDIRLDDKVFEALQAVKAEYCWLCSDGCIPSYKSFCKDIYPILKKKKYDILYLSQQDPYNTNLKEYRDQIPFFKECFWGMTGYGGSILRRHIYGNITEGERERVKTRYSEASAFLYPCYIYDYICSRNFFAVHICSEFYDNNVEKKTSSWMVSGSALYIWGEVLCKVIDLLPTLYDDEKSFVKKSVWTNTGLSSWRRLLAMRSYGCLNAKRIIKYYKNGILNQISDNPLRFAMMLLIPKSVAGICRKLYQSRKRMSQDNESINAC
ncbi:glycosyltransferase [Lacrimispora sp. NSJ-141]|uniref:Glycosyltransferase n=1 Tax=Lientehia hominis TaxID=2897778 RepID=A0AAP2W9Y2_9FIRM|nr:glycosyltransferase [Lientehia hominis]MCD2492279.1 glycosyltransferase [Lientehia hominis]